jgi:hypothetical protein
MEIPECPIAEHAGSTVVRAGWYGKPPHRRQRWLCRPTNGDFKHRFTPVLTRQGEPGAYCVECSTGLEPWEGQAGARDYRFCAREAGEALAAVAAGASYRSAAEAARKRAHREPPRGRRRKPGARVRDRLRDGQIVASWIDVFTGVLCAEELPRSWPRTLLVDSSERIAAQVAHRDPGSPNSTGPVEQVLREVDRRIGDRVGSFTNRSRMSKLLTLMALDLGGEADGRLWADRLRERIYLADGRAAAQRPHDDAKGTHSLFI